MIEDVANLKIHKLLAGHFGGMQQMGSKISNNEIDLLIFLQDPANKKRTPDFYNVLNLCDQYNIPCATNPVSYTHLDVYKRQVRYSA